MPERQKRRAGHAASARRRSRDAPRPLVLAALLAAPGARAEIRSADECAAAVAADPAAAREDAAVWLRMGGGVPARLCEASALAALGAHAAPPPNSSTPSAPIPTGRCPPTPAR